MPINSQIVKSDTPFVSVIMPVRNEADAIRASVGSVLEQDYPHERLELIVADGESNDGTTQLLAKIADTDSRLHVVRNRRRIMAAGFNAGLEVAQGDVVVMMGGHAEMSSAYVGTCVGALQSGEAECAGGVLRTECAGAQAEAIALAMQSPFGVGGVRFRTGCSEAEYVDTVAFGAYKREVITKAGTLDDELVRNQDDEFNYRLRKSGARILLLPQIWCRYQSRATVAALWKQYFGYGFWKVRVLQKHPRQMQWRHFVPPAFVTSLLLLMMLSPFARMAALLLAFVCAMYLVATIAATVNIALHGRKLRSCLIVPLAFAVMHFAYGLGFLIGMFKFRKRWHDAATQPAENSRRAAA